MSDHEPIRGLKSAELAQEIIDAHNRHGSEYVRKKIGRGPASNPNDQSFDVTDMADLIHKAGRPDIAKVILEAIS
jgi:hypothetical protein